MRIVIDMQGAQTESRFRGIGRYALAFAQAVVRNRGKHEVLLVLNGLFASTIVPIRAAFEGLLPQESIRVWLAPGPVKEEEPNNRSRREVAELVREAFIASLRPDVIHITSLFEGFEDDAVSSIGRFERQALVSVSLYDLIPLLNSDQYLKSNLQYADYYGRKIQWLMHAGVLLAISAYTRQEGLDCLNFEASRIVDVSTAIGSEFRPAVVSEEHVLALYRKIGITRPFVLYTGGADERKNLPRLIEAWSALPTALRTTHQLLFAGKMPAGNIAELHRIARAHGLQPDELQFSGYVSDEELVQLYNLCKLYVFPSWHEGFGLPALEAMASGAPVIGANTTSLPEVIGLEDALFDPLNVIAIRDKIGQALTDLEFIAKLRAHGLAQCKRFSWDKTALRAIATWEGLSQKQPEPLPAICDAPNRKPRLAFVSPLPPERTGIADYSAELLPALAEHYDIELVVAQDSVKIDFTKLGGQVRDAAWLRANAQSMERVIYQIGNSPYHSQMLALLEEIPGTVVLHDFFLSGLVAWQERHGEMAGRWTNVLYASHGYGAVLERHLDAESAQRKYPVNWPVLQHALGVIVHSDFSRELAKAWYGDFDSTEWEVIPLVRTPPQRIDRQFARKKLGIGEGDFVVCSFGFLDSTKLNHRLLESWLASALADDKRCRLIFVGENNGGDYGVNLLNILQKCGVGDRITITGFATPEIFQQYLISSDLAVQLRTHSRGETSAAVLDCMNHALPVIVNAHGSMAELDSEAVWVLPDEFSDASLVDAMEQLWRSPEQRRTRGARAQTIIHTRHTPQACAKRYADAIERFHRRTATHTSALINAIAAHTAGVPDKAALLRLSTAIATSLPEQRPARRLFLDVTATCGNDLKTGIERVARAIVVAMLQSPPVGYRIEPVYLTNAGGSWHHRCARSYTFGLLGCPQTTLTDDPIDPQVGDVMLGLDISGSMLIEAERAGLFESYRALGVSVHWVVYDLLPIRMPQVFPPGADESHTRWLQSVSSFDGAICISKAVADEFSAWQSETGAISENRRHYNTNWWHLGADIGKSAPSEGMPENAAKVFEQLSLRPSFLMVGTIEPRKGYLQTIEAFTALWAQGLDVNLVIIGKEGWKGIPDAMRRDIPKTVERLGAHPELNSRLFWLEGISDEYLEKIYAVSTCLIAASYGEGFGLPLIEAAQHKLPIIARDISVFREVAGEHAYYFNASQPDELVQALCDWLALYRTDKHPRSDAMPWLTWQQSATQLVQTTLLQSTDAASYCHVSHPERACTD
ncbi:glycosyltransferase involved in cell wall biosynthesis [Acidovorax sp. 62]|uniref:glycosyltransferase n=1 Tax=Acidovorax sp. 62 TaxID=2035203 RepID=UPI000C18A388|nr:glycosyltransferase [Acidovorax sp. 62]PIF93502.1 glycosyltransferase involved in cell wall biosynthesis [Acidovorax sp. 62]